MQTTDKFILNKVKTIESRSEIEHIVIEGLRRPVKSEVCVTVYFPEFKSQRDTHLYLDGIVYDRDGRLIAIGHDESDMLYGEYYTFDLSGPAGDPVRVTIYDGSLVFTTIESLSNDPGWLGIVRTVMGRYATNRSA